MAAPGVDGVTLTGSSAAGFAAQEACARRRIPLQAELGGNNASLVWEDADLELAAREIAEGAFAQAGPRCTANRRGVVPGEARDRLVELLERETAALPWGDPRDESTRVGPLVSVESRQRIESLLARAGGEAEVVASLAESPSVPGFEGRWHPPTIVRCDDPGHELVQEESFGPVLVVQAAEGWEHAMELVNGVRQGLAAALFSSSGEPWERFLDEAEAGILKRNRSTADAEVDVPFGGWKESGIGPPEHGSFDRDFYTRAQAVYR
jgi:acyl-CoA reductase-like NAD-dependent aldehyde dehydrogenase